MSNTLIDFNRRDINFHQAQVETVVPEHFKEQCPTLVSFLKKFYEYLEEEQGDNNLNNVFYVDDKESTPDSFLDYLFFESINGLGADLFNRPRLTLKLLPNFYPIKGTVISVDTFFRYIYGVSADQFYPKTQIFMVGESEIGPESVRYIQDSYFYQILSIQIKSPLGINQWRDVYKKYNHPAGFALFAETSFETTALNAVMSAPTVVADPQSGAITLEQVSTAMVFDGVASITGIDANASLRHYVDRGVNYYTDSLGDLDSSQIGEYTSIAEIVSTNSPDFSATTGITFSDASLQTMDESKFSYYADSGLDSA